MEAGNQVRGKCGGQLLRKDSDLAGVETRFEEGCSSCCGELPISARTGDWVSCGKLLRRRKRLLSGLDRVVRQGWSQMRLEVIVVVLQNCGARSIYVLREYIGEQLRGLLM